MTTAKVLPIIEPKTLASAAGSLVAAMEKIVDAQDQFADWADLAVLIQNDDGSSTVTRRLEYPLTQECQLWHNMVYGNRQIWKMSGDEYVLSVTGEKIFLEPTDDQMKSPNIRFCARENLNYWEGRMSQYTTDDHGQLTFTAHHADGSVTTGVINPDDDLAYANTQVKTEEARRWHAYAVNRYNAAINAFEVLTGTEFQYKPFVEKARTGNSAANALQLAATLRRR